MKISLNEAGVKTLVNSFKSKNDLSDTQCSELEELIFADPTANEFNGEKHAGKYAVWIGNMYLNGKLKLADKARLTDVLTKYHANKRSIGKKINEYDDVNTLYNDVKNLGTKKDTSRTISKAEQELEKVYEDEYVTVFNPHTYRASRFIGGDTKWCTASSDRGAFDEYSESFGGEFYVIVRKSDGAKFQFHFEADEYRDSEDAFINIWNIFNNKKESEKLVNFFKSKNKKMETLVPRLWPDEIEKELKNETELNKIFDKVSKLGYGCYKVFMGQMRNVITPDRKLLLKYWADNVMTFSDGNFIVIYEGKGRNIVDISGNFIFNKWYDTIDYLYEGFYSVTETEEDTRKHNNYIIDASEKKLFDKPFKETFPFKDGYSIVKKKGPGDKYYYIKFDGTFLTKTGFDDIGWLLDDWETPYFDEKGRSEAVIGDEGVYVFTDGRIVDMFDYNQAEDIGENLENIKSLMERLDRI